MSGNVARLELALTDKIVLVMERFDFQKNYFKILTWHIEKS